MAIGGEIASMYVRLRPNVSGFAAETSAQVKGALTGVQATIDEAAKANVVAASATRDSNISTAASYDQLAKSATLSADQRRIAAKMAADAEAAAAASVSATAEEIVASTVKEAEANIKDAASYRALAHDATQSAEARKVAAVLAANASRDAEAVYGASLVRQKTATGGLLSNFFNLGKGANSAEKEVGKAGRGALAGSGVFRDLGRSLAFASGGFLLFAGSSRVISDSLKGAESIQKSGEAIRSGFGAAAQAVLNFADRSAAGLGISAQLADATAARFAILFQNLGIGQQEAAGMTIGWEKLAGAISSIKGVDPTQVLQNIALAAAGNARGLTQLGISVTATTIKYAAWRLGLISSLHDAITPSIRAQALYALATAKLPQFLDQAAKHSHDLANEQARLGAEFTNAKDKLGNALIPVFLKYTTELANWLQRMNESGKLQRDFNHAVDIGKKVVGDIASIIRTTWPIFKTAAGWVGGVVNVLKILLALKVADWVIGVVAGIGKISAAEAIATSKTGILKLAIEGLGGAEVLGPLALLAAGIGAIYYGMHQAAKEATGFQAKMGVISRDNKTGALSFREDTANRGPNPMHRITVAQAIKLSADDALTQQLVSTKALAKAEADSPRIGAAAFRAAADQVEQARTKKAKDVATARLKALKESLSQELAAQLAAIKSNGNAVAAAQDAANQQIQASVDAAKRNLDAIATKLAASTDKLLTKLGLKTGAGANSPETIAYQKLLAVVKSGGSTVDLARAATGLATQVQNTSKDTATTQKDRISRQFHDLVDEFNKGAISLKTFNKRLSADLAADHVSYRIAGKASGVAFADGWRAEVQGIREQAAALAATPARLRRDGAGATGPDASIKIVRPLEVINRENQKIAGIASRQRERQLKAELRTAKATEKVAAEIATAKGIPIGTLPNTKAKKYANSAAKRHGR